jgi:hypothetical protein
VEAWASPAPSARIARTSETASAILVRMKGLVRWMVMDIRGGPP